jgi:hypothetical protein
MTDDPFVVELEAKYGPAPTWRRFRRDGLPRAQAERKSPRPVYTSGRQLRLWGPAPAEDLTW